MFLTVIDWPKGIHSGNSNSHSNELLSQNGIRLAPKSQTVFNKLSLDANSMVIILASVGLADFLIYHWCNIRLVILCFTNSYRCVGSKRGLMFAFKTASPLAMTTLNHVVSSGVVGAAAAEEQASLAASCVGRCLESYFPGRPCYCNEACDQYENCCFDYYTECQREFNVYVFYFMSYY